MWYSEPLHGLVLGITQPATCNPFKFTLHIQPQLEFQIGAQGARSFGRLVTVMSHWIVIPTYNERQNILALIPEIFLVMPNAKLMVVDDNSPDGTVDIVRNLQLTYPNLHLHVRSAKMGLGSAYIGAIEKLLATESFEMLTTMDADFSHSPEHLRQMRDLITEYDLVIGSRYVRNGGTVGWPFRRRLLSRCGNIYARFVTQLSVNDFTSGFITFRRTLLEKIPLERIRCNGYAFLIELKCLAIFAGARPVETPIIFTERREGASKLALSIIFEAVSAPWRMRSLRSNHEFKRELALARSK